MSMHATYLNSTPGARTIRRWATAVAIIIAPALLSSNALAAGKLKGNAGGNERGAIAFDREGHLRGWTVTGPSGMYEFSGLEPGAYMMLLNGKIVPYVTVEDGQTTRIDQANQPKLSWEKEVWGPSRVSFAQSYIATGTAVTGISLWRASGGGKLLVSLYEDSPSGRRIAGPYETEKEMVWICWTSLPADEFKTTPGKRYAIELTDAAGKPWNHSMPRQGDVYPHGDAFYDRVPHPESDLGIDINEAHPGLIGLGARDDLHFIKEGPGSGTCLVAGQTFIAKTVNVLRVYANCGWGAGIEDFIFTIRKDGPGGEQVGPEVRSRMVANWGTDAVWFPDSLPVTAGERYYLEYRRADGEPFFSYLSSDVYKEGRAFRDGKMLDEQFDQLFGVVGEMETDSVTYPYNVRVTEITDTQATITWQTGTPSDGVVHYGTTGYLTQRTRSEDARERDHRIVLDKLKPGTVYMYRVSSDTHKQSSRRMYSRIYSFLTEPGGDDEPRFDKPEPVKEPPACPDCITVVNPGFEDGLTGWSRLARAGREKEPERYDPDPDPFGRATAGLNGYEPHSGTKMYGWSYFGPDDPTWREGREDWKREIIYQTIDVEPERVYLFTAHLLTGDRGSGWGRDTRMRMAVDERAADLFNSFETIDQANVTQWFATQHQWQPVTMMFKARAKQVTIGIEFLQWWALEANHLYVDEITVVPAPTVD